MEDLQPMPDFVARYFASVVEDATGNVFRHRAQVLAFEDLKSEAWIIAAQRWQLWSDQQAAACKDLTLQLHQWLDKYLYALGWTRPRGEDGKQRWVAPVNGEIPFERMALENMAAPEVKANEPESPGTFVSRMDWQPIGNGLRERYARILISRYPELVGDFITLDSVRKPPRVSAARFRASQNRERAKLRVKWAAELATARYAVEGFEEPKAA